MCIYIISFSEELKPSFAYSIAPLIYKSQKNSSFVVSTTKICEKGTGPSKQKSVFNVPAVRGIKVNFGELTRIMFNLSIMC